VIDGILIDALQRADAEAMLAVFNHYVAHSFAAYPEKPLTIDGIHRLLDGCDAYPRFAARDGAGNLVGFGFLSAYSPHDAFCGTTQITYFLAPEHTGRGIGSRLLARLEDAAREAGIEVILAHVSSENPGSLAFHRRHGFTECGRFRGIGIKHGRRFDVVWFQKRL